MSIQKAMHDVCPNTSDEDHLHTSAGRRFAAVGHSSHSVVAFMARDSNTAPVLLVIGIFVGMKPVIESSFVYLGPGECENCVHDARRGVVVSTPSRYAKEDFFMRRIKCQTRDPVSSKLFYRDLITRRNIATIVNAPGAN